SGYDQYNYNSQQQQPPNYGQQHQQPYAEQGYNQYQQEYAQQGFSENNSQYGRDDEYNGYDNKSSDGQRGGEFPDEEGERGIKEFFTKTNVDAYNQEHSELRTGRVVGAALLTGLVAFGAKKYIDNRKEKQRHQMAAEIGNGGYGYGVDHKPHDGHAPHPGANPYGSQPY
ncbi:hypothetical protein LPJ73_002535, partial [Coemansia sp. RSA 2703]